MRRNVILIAIASAGILLLSANSLLQPIEVDVAPLAEVVVNGQRNWLNPSIHLTEASPQAINDALHFPSHLLSFAEDRQDNTVELHFPFRVLAQRMMVAGNGRQELATLRMSFDRGGGHWEAIDPIPWHSIAGNPAVREGHGRQYFQAIQCRFLSEHPVCLNSIAVFVALPRWQAWLYFLSLTIVGPWAIALSLTAAVLGLGRACFGVLRSQPSDIGQVIVAGITVLLALSVIWLALPRSTTVDAIFLSTFLTVAVGETARRWRQRRNSTALSDDDRLIVPMAFVSLLLLVTIAADCYGVGTHRVEPLDHLIGFLGAQCLSRDLSMPAEMAARPWLVHVLYAPWDKVLGRFSYWGYLGMLAGLNSFITIPAALLSRRWNVSERWMVGLIALMPITALFHFLGQRPLTAALALIGLLWYRWPVVSRQWLWGGWAIALAIGAHPSALFVLPVLALDGWFADQPGHGWRAALRNIQVPALAYLTWTLYMRYLYPEGRNDLMFYPLMRTLEEQFDPRLDLASIVLSLDADHWLDLGRNRLEHLRHYLWTDNLTGSAAGLLRWISIPNILGVTLSFGLLRPSFWRFDVRWLLLAVLGPLAAHHLHIGQGHAQFHISPTPFFGLALLLIASLLRDNTRVCRTLIGLAMVEWLARSIYPLGLVLGAPRIRESTLDRIQVFGIDNASYATLSLLPMVCWLVGAFLLLGRKPKNSNPPADCSRLAPGL